MRESVISCDPFHVEKDFLRIFRKSLWENGARDFILVGFMKEMAMYYYANRLSFTAPCSYRCNSMGRSPVSSSSEEADFRTEFSDNESCSHNKHEIKHNKVTILKDGVFLFILFYFIFFACV